MDFLIKDGRFTQNGLCLVSAYNDWIGIGSVDFLNEEATIEQYREWEYERTNNLISISKPHQVPQTICNKSIERVAYVGYLQEMARMNLNNETDLEIPEDYYIGNRTTFRGLLTRLWNTKGNLFDYQSTTQDYYRQAYENEFRERNKPG